MNIQKDVFVLEESSNDRFTMKILLSEKNKKRSLFSRHILTYTNGSIVSKHCAPYGNLDLLSNDMFIIKRKFFNSNSELVNVLIEHAYSSSVREYLIGPDFFLGWLDTSALEISDKFTV